MKMDMITAIAGTALLAWSALSVRGNTDHSPKAEKRNVPPTVYLSFPDTIQVKTIYIYPSEIVFQPGKSLKPHAKLNAVLSNLHEQPLYEREVACNYNPDDHTFWVAMPDDAPSKLSVKIRGVN